MPLSAGGLLDRINIGNDAGWALTFHKEKDGKVTEEPVITLRRDDYYAEISAELPEALEGGAYEVVIEGITDNDYAKFAQTGDSAPSVMRLYLYWRDTNDTAKGYMANIAGITDLVGTKVDPDTLVAELSITAAKLQKGAKRYEAKITGRERVFQKLNARMTTPIKADTPIDTAEAIAKNFKVEPVVLPVTTGTDQSATGGNPGSEKREEGDRVKAVDVLRTLAKRMEEASGKFGRGMLLIRKGKLYIGERSFPLEGDQKDLVWSTGLVQVEASGTAESEEPAKGSKAKAAVKRRKFKLTLKGRPDLMPGDLVSFDLPPQEVSTTIGSWTGVIGDLFKGPFLPTDKMENPVNLYVAGVQHKLGKKSGFVTVVSGLEIKDLADPWDPAPTTSGQVSDSTPEGKAVIAIQKQVKGLLEAQRFDEVAEVRATTTSGSDEPPSQTELLWRGIAPSDGRANQGRRLAIARPSPAPASDAAYLTPFAWGKTGLVLPRYPGTRVLVSHRGGERDDPIDVGALWESGHGPESEAGDWWLILPIGVPNSERQSLSESAEPNEHTGQVSQDLTDAEGNRIIEVGALTVRVGLGSMKSAGERPELGDADSITIEHADGDARIVIKKDGSITIEGAKIQIKATGDLDLEGANVNVKVSGQMNVS